MCSHCCWDCKALQKMRSATRSHPWLLPLLVTVPSLLFIANHVSNSRDVSLNVGLLDDNDYTGFLDDCYHVYLDVGSNVGIQVRKLFQPELYPEAQVLPLFNNMFGNVSRNPGKTCAVGFEANFAHTEQLLAIDSAFKKCGWRVFFFTQRAVSDKDHGKTVTFYSDGEKNHKEWGASLVADNVNLKGKLASKVKLLRLSKFVLEAVANRRLPKMEDTSLKPAVVMKLDIEGSEIEVLTDLSLSGALQHIDQSMIEYHDRLASNKERKQLSRDLQSGLKAMDAISQNGMTPIHISDLDDETYGFSNLPLPQCH